MRTKFNLYLLLLLLLSIGASSCKKASTPAYKCATCSTTPTALAANDHIAKGVYKGTVVGSTGTMLIDIQNSTGTITAVMVIDGQTVNFTSLSAYTAGQPFSGSFSGTLNGQTASFNFSVDASGNNPTVTIGSIPGHAAAVIFVFKELSTGLVETYEGTFNGTSSGIFNMVVNTSTNDWVIIAKDNTKTTTTSISGVINGTTVTCTSCTSGGGTISGTVSGDNVSGSWNDGSTGSGGWSGQRTL